MLIYSENAPPYSGPPGLLQRMNPTRQWCKHYDNLLLLTMFLTRGTAQEKMDASRELRICERKLLYWERQETFDPVAAVQHATQAKEQWQLSPGYRLPICRQVPR